MSRNDVGPLHLSNCRKKLCPEPNKRAQDSRVLYTCPSEKDYMLGHSNVQTDSNS